MAGGDQPPRKTEKGSLTADSVIGALRVNLSAGSADFAKDMAKAQASLATFSTSVSKQMTSVRMVVLRALGPDDLFKGKTLGALVAALNNLQRNGGKILVQRR